MLGGQVCIVGATDNPALPNPQNALLDNTVRAGFVMQCSGPLQIGGVKRTYYVQPRDGLPCELVGIGGWSEFDDHLYATGWIEKPAVAQPNPLPLRQHGFVISLFRDTTASTASLDLLQLREWHLDDAIGSQFLPASTPNGFANSGWPVGGGIAVDERGIATVVGSTFGGTDFPVVGFGLNMEAGHATSPLEHDACAVVIDLLPPGARRSDGTGDPQAAWAPPSGVDGGTTPVCARAVFGRTIGVEPSLPRMLIDLEGTPGPGNSLAIVVDRPPVNFGLLSFGFFRIGFPEPLPDPAQLAAFGIEFWMDPGDWLLAPQVVSGGSLRDPLFGAGGLPLGNQSFSLQFYTMMTQGFAGCPTGYTFAASPALYFEY